MRINDDITVLVAFGMPFRVKPLSFTWSGRTIEITEVTYTWKTKEGQKDLHHFSVTDGNTLYELTFDAISLLWKIESLEA